MMNYSKTPVYQADITNIQNQFMAVIKEIKKDIGSDLELQKALSKQVTEQMFRKLTKGQELQHPAISPEQLADAITGTVANAETINHEKPNAPNHALVELFLTKPEGEHS